MKQESNKIPNNFSLHIKGKKWQIRFVKSKEISRYSYGECDWPSAKNPKIFVRRHLSDAQLLNTTIHEIIHAVRPELCEEAVIETANVITAALRKMKCFLPRNVSRKKKSAKKSKSRKRASDQPAKGR